MVRYGQRQRSPTKSGQVVKPQEPTSLNMLISSSQREPDHPWTFTPQDDILVYMDV